jgi:nucleoredoxin
MTDTKQTGTTTALEELLGETLLKRTGEDGPENVSLSSLLVSKKQIILYFSAHWCPPCRGFTPLLSDPYDGYKKKMITTKEETETEIVFISSDSSEQAFAEYHKEMTFPALPFDKKRGEQLMTKFGVEGIPSMVAIDGNGEVVQKGVDFRSLVDAHGADAFPLTPERVA